MWRSLRDSLRDVIGVVPRSVRWTAGGLLLVVVVLMLLRGGGQEAEVPVAAGAPQRPGGAVMLRRDGGAVVGVLRTTDGAAAAALSYVGQRNALLTGGTTAAEAVDVASALAVGGRDVGEDPASIPDRAGATNLQAQLRTRAGQMVWWTIPFGFRTRSWSSSRAVVRVYAGLLSAGAQLSDGPAALSLTLQDVELRWRAGAWRIWDVRETRDQPTAITAVGLSTRPEVLGGEFRDRIVPAKDQTGQALYAFLRDARPVLSGPVGMGRPAGAGALDGDAARITEVLGRVVQRGVQRERMSDGGAPGRWAATVPVAFKAVRCDSDEEARCYVVLLAGVGQQEGPAVASFTVGRIVFASDGSGQLVAPSAQLEQEVLGGTVTVTSSVEDDARISGAAWNRSIVGLRPTVPALAR